MAEVWERRCARNRREDGGEAEECKGAVASAGGKRKVAAFTYGATISKRHQLGLRDWDVECFTPYCKLRLRRHTWWWLYKYQIPMEEGRCQRCGGIGFAFQGQIMCRECRLLTRAIGGGDVRHVIVQCVGGGKAGHGGMPRE